MNAVRLAPIACGAALVALVGCNGLFGKASITTVNGVAGAEVGLTAAFNLAAQYEALPRCGSAGATVLCSSQTIVDRIKSAAKTAHDAVKAAENNEGTVQAALDAIDAFKAVIPPAPVPAPAAAPAAASK